MLSQKKCLTEEQDATERTALSVRSAISAALLRAMGCFFLDNPHLPTQSDGLKKQPLESLHSFFHL